MSASWCRMKYLYNKLGFKLLRHANITLPVLTTSQTTYLVKHFSKGSRKNVASSKTPESGYKKDISDPLPIAYTPQFVEQAWYDWWQGQGYFCAVPKVDDPEEVFVMILPPPNITGTLHLGHALTNSIQDALVRWHRMHGRVTVWVPGCDHAGIATQVVVEKKLWQEQRQTRHQLGREEFVEQVWKWKHEKLKAINKQMKRLGSSLDWSRSCFTMDDRFVQAVNEAFVRLHDDGLIYRNKRIVNWSCSLKSAVSDIEVDNIPIDGRTLLHVPGYEKKIPFGVISSFAYPVHESDEEIVVSTTRLETMLGDTGVAVHPDDARYTHLHGRKVTHPLTGRLLPIVCDSFVDREFGTGAVKLTPGHDTTDFQVAHRHDLDILSVINDEGLMENVPEMFLGMRRFDARRRVASALTDSNLFRGHQDHSHSIPVCSRSKDIIEPRLKEQWFVNCQDMAQDAIDAVVKGKLSFSPRSHEKEWLHWLTGIRDWCISRQLWWGHRIPAYRVLVQDGSITWIAGRTESEARRKAAVKLGIKEEDIVMNQDEDVLDTWFSSALYPFAALGWPQQGTDLDRFYPNSLLETGSDIIFFWVARMVMMGIKLTGQIPFQHVLFHGILRDSHGRKMSKSLGNVIDPMDVIQGKSLQDLQEQLERSNLDPSEIKTASAGQKKDFPKGIPACGADALRFTLCSYNFKAGEINMDVSHVLANRHFCNKIWQAFRFITNHLGEGFKPAPVTNVAPRSVLDRWILSRLSFMVQSCDAHFKSYDLHCATKALHQFWLSELCDVYLECVKPVFVSGSAEEQKSAKEVLYLCMETYLRAISPFTPYIAEELFQRLPTRGDNWSESVCIAGYPLEKDYPWYTEELDQVMSLVQDIAHESLSMRKDLQLTKVRASAYITCTDSKLLAELSPFRMCAQTLSRSKEVEILSDGKVVPDGCVHLPVTDSCTISILLQDCVNPYRDLPRLEVKVKKLEQQLDLLAKKPFNSDDDIIDKKNLDKISDVTVQLLKMKNIVSTIEKLK